LQPPILYKNRGSCYFSPLYYGGFCRRSSYWECKRKFSGIYAAIQLFWQWAYFLCRLSGGRYGEKVCFAYLCRTKKRRLDNRGRRQLFYCCKRRLGITIPSCGADYTKNKQKGFGISPKPFYFAFLADKGNARLKNGRAYPPRRTVFLAALYFLPNSLLSSPFFSSTHTSRTPKIRQGITCPKVTDPAQVQKISH